jgi:2-dehydropantoate 2-reductase
LSVKILVFGAGAIGSFFGGLLSQRHDVTLVGRPTHVSAIRNHGLRIRGKTALIAHPRAVTTLPVRIRPDLVLVSTKAYATEEAVRILRPLAAYSLFVTLQNGLENADIIARSARRVVAGTTAHGVTFVDAGEVRHAGIGDTTIGIWKGATRADLIRIRDVFEEGGIRTRLSPDIRADLWAKVAINAGINPIAALAGVTNGRIARDRRLAALLESLVREAAGIANEEGVALDAEAVVHSAILVARRTSSNRASMLQDLDRGRPTEIDAIAGAVVRAADRHGMDAPLNRAMLALVAAREHARRTDG